MKILRGKKALVTGAASGIGRAIALALAREGADLYLLDIDLAGLMRTADEASMCGVEIVTERCDLQQPDEITARIDELKERWGRLDLLINNAGVAYYGATDKMTQAQWDWILGINLRAPIQITHELLPLLLEQPEAHILNLCSISGLVAGGRFCAYHVTKFGLVGFSEALRAEYARRGLGVTALCPGPVRTNLYRAAQSGRKDGTVPQPPRWICTTEQHVARCAIRAIRRNRRMVLITPLAHLLFQLKRFTPSLLDALHHIGRRKKRTPSAISIPAPAQERRAA